MEARPKLSIGIPVYNGGRFLAELLVNLQEQSFGDFEIVICDNASTDRTQEIGLEYASRDPRIRYYRNDYNLGANPNYCKVFALAKAPLFKWSAHDDLYGATFLETCVKLLDDNPDAALAFTDCLCIDEDARPFPPSSSPLGPFVDPRSGEICIFDPLYLASQRWAVARFWEILFRMRCNAQVFGVIRRDALARTSVMANFYGADKLVLAELAILGRFCQSPERLYQKRFHKDMSWTLSVAERKQWSQTGGGPHSLRLRQLTGFTAAPFGKGLSVADLALCLAAVPLLGPKVMLGAVRGHERTRKALITPWRQSGATTDSSPTTS